MRYNILAWILLLTVGIWGCTDKEEQTAPKPNTTHEAYQWPEKAAIVSIVVQVQGAPTTPTTVILESYYWDLFRPIAEYKLADNAEILHQLKGNYQVGLYRLILPEEKDARPVYFVVNGEDERIDVVATYQELLQGKAKISPEDEVFVLNETILLHRGKTQAEDSIKTLLSDVTAINPKYYSIKDSLREAFELSRLKFYQDLDRLKESYPNTYITHAVVDLLRKPSRYENPELKAAFETEPAMLNRHYFDGINIDNPAYLGHPIFYQSINEYISEYAGERPQEWLTSIDYLMSAISEPTIKQTVADYLVFHYLDRNMDSLAQQIAMTHIPGCSDDYVANLKKSDRYRAGPQLNNAIPPLTLPNVQGKTVDVGSIVAQNKVTLIYFWKSTCNFCDEEHPVIRLLHERYADKGLAIVGISLDTDKSAWTNAIAKHRMDWINLCDLRGVTSPAIYDYAIKGTPATFIVSNKGNLVAKDLKGRTLQEFFQAYFNQINP